MNKVFLVIVYLISSHSFSQNELAKAEIPKTEEIKPNIIQNQNPDCDYFINTLNKDENYKSTKLSLIYLNDYAGNIDRVYFSLLKRNEIPSLNVEFMLKSSEDELDMYKCFNKSSKIEFVLKNGSKITLLHIDDNSCLKIDESDIYSKKKKAILTGSFRFLMGNMDILKTSPIVTMEVKFANGIQDYVIQKNIFLESDNMNFEPANYFIKNLNCIEN